MTQDANPQRFHIDRSISIGHIFTTLSMVFCMLYWASTVETRLAVQENKFNEGVAAQTRQQTEMKDLKVEINFKLDRLEGKMDRIIEGRK